MYTYIRIYIYTCIYIYIHIHHGFICAIVKAWYTDMFIQHHERSSAANGLKFT